MTRLYSYVCALHVCVYSYTYCKESGYTCDCYFLWFTCSSAHFAKVQFATISITFVKATGQSNILLRLASCVHLSLSLFLKIRNVRNGIQTHTHSLLDCCTSPRNVYLSTMECLIVNIRLDFSGIITLLRIFFVVVFLVLLLLFLSTVVPGHLLT